LGGHQEDYVLNEILLSAADTAYKPLVILGIDSNESYITVRDKILRAMPHPLTCGGSRNRNKQAQANNTVGPSHSNQSGGKQNSKSRNSIKNLNAKFQNSAGRGDRTRCPRCLNLGHDGRTCKTDLSKKCSNCSRFGHLVSECWIAAKGQQSSGNSVNTVAKSNPPPLLYKLPLVKCICLTQLLITLLWLSHFQIIKQTVSLRYQLLLLTQDPLSGLLPSLKMLFREQMGGLVDLATMFM